MVNIKKNDPWENIHGKIIHLKENFRMNENRRTISKPSIYIRIIMKIGKMSSSFTFSKYFSIKEAI